MNGPVAIDEENTVEVEEVDSYLSEEDTAAFRATQCFERRQNAFKLCNCKILCQNPQIVKPLYQRHMYIASFISSLSVEAVVVTRRVGTTPI